MRISIDDFGTGYSSLAYLRRFPIDKLKIDIAFIRDITHNPDAAAIALAIIRMAHSLNLQVVAEGVETQEQLAYLHQHRCDQVQGYCFSRPLPLPDLERLLAARAKLDVPAGAGDASVSRLLLVDDDLDHLQRMQALFEEDGYRVMAAHSADEGFALLALTPAQVILCDRYMPGMDGIEFLGRVKSLYPDTLRIVLSATQDLESIIHAINEGAVFRFYGKPCEPAELRRHVADAFRHYWRRHEHTEPAMAGPSTAFRELMTEGRPLDGSRGPAL